MTVFNRNAGTCLCAQKKRLYSVFLILILYVFAGASQVIAQDILSPASKPFSRQIVIDEAEALSKSSFVRPKSVPESLKNLDYDTYRQIRYRKNEAIWAKSRTPFNIELFAPGFLYTDLIDILIVENRVARPLKVDNESFEVPDPALSERLVKAGKFAGFRLHYPLNTEAYRDEFTLFQGASYFRAVSKGQIYGLSARGLALNVGMPAGEEFPVFRKYWIERPDAAANAIVIHALLDSKSVTGAFRFGIYPGDTTRMEVSASLFPRKDLDNVGLAPLTSMYMFSALDESDVPDYRPSVHDSDGLGILRGNDESLWRPLANPRSLQFSAFSDTNTKGYGLIQRSRKFEAYQDLEANYEKRPSSWVEPIGDWGEGAVELVEIPSDSEGNDNVVAFWRPKNPLPANQRFDYSYRLTWPNDTPSRDIKPRVIRSALGQKLKSPFQEFVIDYAGEQRVNFEELRVDSSASGGRIIESRFQPSDLIKGGRVFLTFDPEGEDMIEFRVQLKNGDESLGETWLYRWYRD